MKERDQQICDIWDDLEDEFDKSTAWMMAMTIDRFMEIYGKEIDETTVAEALYHQHLQQEAANDQTKDA